MTIIDHNSDKTIIKKFQRILNNQFFESEIIKLDIKKYKKNIKKINQQGKIVTDNQISNMSNINQSLNLGKNCEDLVYFVEDDYIHKPDAIEEMIYAYERISTQLGTELIMCPADYPYLYNKVDNSKILLGNKYGLDAKLGNFVLEGGYQDDNQANDYWFGNISYVVNFGSEDKNNTSSNSKSLTDVSDQLYRPVKRENKIRVVKIDASGVVVGGF